MTHSCLSAPTTNSLPLISEVAGAPEDCSKDLHDLRELLSKHNVPNGVSVRLIHKHFDTIDGEVMLFDKIPVPGHNAKVQIMKPVMSTDKRHLRGIHYFVDGNSSLQAYEYVTYDVPDMSNFEPFLTEFCNLVSERGLQHVFGLKLQHEDGDTTKTGWTEYELPAKRGTIMFPDGMPMPDGESDFSVVTEWQAIINELTRTCKHSTTCRQGASTCKHCKHCARHDSANADDNNNVNTNTNANEPGFCLGGQTILPGNPVHEIVDGIIAAF